MSAIQESASHSELKSSPGHITSSTSPRENQISFIAGTIPSGKVAAFERLIWRISRGTILVRCSDIETLLQDPHTVRRMRLFSSYCHIMPPLLSFFPSFHRGKKSANPSSLPFIKETNWRLAWKKFVTRKLVFRIFCQISLRLCWELSLVISIKRSVTIHKAGRFGSFCQICLRLCYELRLAKSIKRFGIFHKAGRFGSFCQICLLLCYELRLAKSIKRFGIFH